MRQIKQKSKTVLITGASGGIGSALCEEFFNLGYTVIANYNKNKPSHSFFDYCVCASLSNTAGVNGLISFVNSTVPFVDVLINNAGISYTQLFDMVTPKKLNEILSVNLSSAIILSQAISKKMISKKQGCIINISSLWGLVGASCEVHYSAAKAGLIGFTKALAKELAPSSITVNAICPGAVKTPMLEGYSKGELEHIKNEALLKRLLEAKDIAHLAAFLASEGASYITGEAIRV